MTGCLSIHHQYKTYGFKQRQTGRLQSADWRDRLIYNLVLYIPALDAVTWKSASGTGVPVGPEPCSYLFNFIQIFQNTNFTHFTCCIGAIGERCRHIMHANMQLVQGKRVWTVPVDCASCSGMHGC